MAGLGPAIHVFADAAHSVGASPMVRKSWMAGPSPAMTGRGLLQRGYAIASRASDARARTAAKTKTRRRFAKNATAPASHSSASRPSRPSPWAGYQVGFSLSLPPLGEAEWRGGVGVGGWLGE